MDAPDNISGEVTEIIMAKIESHLKDDNETHHYNRVYEAIYAILREYEEDV